MSADPDEQYRKIMQEKIQTLDEARLDRASVCGSYNPVLTLSLMPINLSL